MSAKALIVDDSRAVRMILTRHLRQLDYEVAEAGDGLEALAILATGEPFELALLDWNMPRMNGLELLERLRSSPRYDAMRIIMVTTVTVAEQIATALAAGANEYVMKPFTREILLGKLQIAGVPTGETP
ncbi:MAG TPA: response regulator [Bryobacteraceae bacterium]|nr:response regulator [Bryobacteraceae bacterium]